MNEAQKKLYKKLLKSLDQKDEDDELDQMAASNETPAEIYARKLALDRKNEDMMRAKAERRLKKKQEKEEVASKIKLENIKKKKIEEARKKKEEEEVRVGAQKIEACWARGEATSKRGASQARRRSFSIIALAVASL